MRGKCSCGWEGIVNGQWQCMLCEHIEEEYKAENAVGIILMVLIVVCSAVFFGYDALAYLTLHVFGG